MVVENARGLSSYLDDVDSVVVNCRRNEVLAVFTLSHGDQSSNMRIDVFNKSIKFFAASNPAAATRSQNHNIRAVPPQSHSNDMRRKKMRTITQNNDAGLRGELRFGTLL